MTTTKNSTKTSRIGFLQLVFKPLQTFSLVFLYCLVDFHSKYKYLHSFSTNIWKLYSIDKSDFHCLFWPPAKISLKFSKFPMSSTQAGPIFTQLFAITHISTKFLAPWNSQSYFECISKYYTQCLPNWYLPLVTFQPKNSLLWVWSKTTRV